MSICKNCGRSLAENEVCNCTAALSDSENQQKKQPKKKSDLVNALIIVAAVLMIVTFCYVFLFIFLNRTSTPTSRANGNAASLYKATCSALTELDEEGYNVGGYFIICSDSKKNYNVPDNFDTDEFFKIVNKYFDDSKKMEWFAICEAGNTVYLAQSKKWDTEIVGTYPNSATEEGPSFYDPAPTNQYPPIAKRGKATLKELYDVASDKVRANPEGNNLKED